MAPRILVDGRSGSGKTEFAAALARAIPRAQLVRLDDMYPGWDGLDAASAAVSSDVLERHRWRRWDWASDAPAEWHELDPARPLIVEGCGAISAGSRRLATSAIWIELDAATRKRRALARDGEAYAPHWERWARQEDAFLLREDPASLADAVVDGADVALGLTRWLFGWRDRHGAATMGV